MDCSPPGSSVHGISQARILDWVAISFFRGSSQSRDQSLVSCISCRFFDHCVTWEAYDPEPKATEEMDTQCQASSTNKRQLGDTGDLPLGGPHRVLLSCRDAEPKILSLGTDIPDVWKGEAMCCWHRACFWTWQNLMEPSRPEWPCPERSNMASGKGEDIGEWSSKWLQPPIWAHIGYEEVLLLKSFPGAAFIAWFLRL